VLFGVHTYQVFIEVPVPLPLVFEYRLPTVHPVVGDGLLLPTPHVGWPIAVVNRVYPIGLPFASIGLPRTYIATVGAVIELAGDVRLSWMVTALVFPPSVAPRILMLLTALPLTLVIATTVDTFTPPLTLSRTSFCALAFWPTSIPLPKP
jgi:hypothetical protein